MIKSVVWFLSLVFECVYVLVFVPLSSDVRANSPAPGVNLDFLVVN